jgi:hypothetical protein
MSDKFPIDVLSVKKYLKKGSDAQLARIGHVNALAEEVVANKLIQDAIVEQLEETPAPADSRPYKVYTALLTQSGTNAPVATVLENTLGGVPVHGYSDVGYYTVSLADAFPSATTATFIHNKERQTYSFYKNDGRIDIINLTYTGDPVEGLFSAMFEIRVYND